MRVLFHVLDAGVGGGQLVARRVAEALVERGDSVGLVVAGDGPLVDAFGELGAQVTGLQLAELRQPQAALRARGLVATYDVLYSHTSAPGQIVCATAAMLARRPHVAHQHTVPYFSTRAARGAAQRQLFRVATRGTRFIAVAEHVAAGLHASGVDADRITVIPNGVPLHELSASRAPGPLRVGMVARLDPNKGLETFIEAARATAGAQFSIAGRTGPDAAYDRTIRAQAAAAGVEIVEAAGDDFLGSVDIAVLPSRHEGSPLALLEAMAAGRTVVASDIPGVREVLAGEAGVLVPVGDAGAVARAVERLTDDHTRAEYGARARAVIESRYRLDQMTGRAIDILDGAVRG